MAKHASVYLTEPSSAATFEHPILSGSKYTDTYTNSSLNNVQIFRL